MGDEHRTNKMLNFAAGKTPQCEFPEFDLVIAENTNFPEDITQHRQAELDVLPRRLLPRPRPLDLVRVGLADLIFVARQELAGLISATHARAPRPYDVLVGQVKIDVGF